MTAISSPPVRHHSRVASRSTAPRLWRRLLRNPRVRRAACWAIHCYIRLVYRTNRWTVEDEEFPRRLLATGQPFIGAFWHGRMMMIPLGWRRMARMHMLISAHRDGRIIADAVAYFGIDAIAGSTRRGGSAALRTMLKRLKEGDCIAITPDGPRGPAMSASAGIVNVARLAQVPIVPITYATSRRHIAATWDRFHIALPFGRGVFLWGEPIEIAAELDECGLESARRLVEQRMSEMMREADRRVGHPVPLLAAAEPMPVPSRKVVAGASGSASENSAKPAAP
ncbi:MAG: lysophospholipid acyltransferase family protein [Stellaceae bacterium]